VNVVESTGARERLMGPNGGRWDGTFIRCGADGQEQERFPTSLQVTDTGGAIEAALTYCHTGQVRSMRFQEPPPEMQIAPSGHWSLGPDRIGPWPWFAELCLVHGDRRRRVVLRHGSADLETFVQPGLELATVMGRQLGDPVACLLRWRPEPGIALELVRRYGASGLLEPLTVT
jgi:hypothetical protein